MASKGQNLRKIRKHKGLSQFALSVLSGVSRPEISAIERDKCNPKIEIIGKLAHALKVLSFQIDESLKDKNKEGMVREMFENQECQKICHDLDQFEKDMLLKYSKLPREIRKEFYKRWDTELDDAQKKEGHVPFEDIKDGSAG
jgi:transcriptional regulator with XRE-family HTH domain